MPPRRRTLLVSVLAVPALLVGLSGCGFDVQTNQNYTPAEGVNAQDGTVDALNVLIVSGTEGSGTLVAGLANNDAEQADRLTAVQGADENADLSVQLPAPVEIPPGGFVDLSDEGQVRLTGEDVVPGEVVTVTLTFERAEAVTVPAPVVDNEGPYADVPVS